ncbi:hypothetical protein [Pontixanthobacter luteolus]|uniref:hypothetical protein n=1 Tax=Pontixanthobacter luteolus TaxID=295089 RepID=UPI002303D9DB|nr:hypothetical protein [Pontixanthobacter luteolus]
MTLKVLSYATGLRPGVGIFPLDIGQPGVRSFLRLEIFDTATLGCGDTILPVGPADTGISASTLAA